MDDTSGLLKHAHDVGHIIVLFVVYVVVLGFGTTLAALRRGYGRVRAAGGSVVRGVTRVPAGLRRN